MTTSLVQNEFKLQDFLKAGKRAYLIGVGGVGMSGLALTLKHLGLQVSGSDAKSNRFTSDLTRAGIPVSVGHDLTHVYNQDFVIYSSAVSVKNPERREAILRGVPLFHRAEVLSAIMNQAISVAVTGTHGKTTTSAMIGFLMMRSGLKPTCVVGGHVIDFEANVLLGDPHLIVAEVDESDKTQLFFQPDYTVLTNLEEDHLDTYQNMDNLKASFKDFVSHLKTTGHVIYSGHDDNLKEIVDEMPRRADFGFSRKFTYGAEDVALQGFGSRFVLYEKGERAGEVKLSVPGKHNILNALGAIAVLRQFGVSIQCILTALPDFRGVGRRLEIKHESERFLVIDDYAHHPTEVEASLQAIRTLKKPTTVIFQPHRYSRTKYLASAFAKAFYLADRLILTDIYGAGEENVDQIEVEDLYDMIKETNHPNVSIVSKDKLLEHLCSDETLRGTVAFLGAGDITEIANEFAKRIANPR